MRKALIAANWKMNGDSNLIKEFAAHSWTFPQADTVFGLPATLLAKAQFAPLAGQDVSAHENGAHTGEISAAMLREAGATYVILGHSERRTDHGETESLLIEKWRQAKKQNLKVIYCIGESLAEYEEKKTSAALLRQLEPILAADLLTEADVIAYEPVWAIGTGKSATAAYAQEVHREIRGIIRGKYANIAQLLRIVYGGSVKPENAKDLFSGEDIDGFLVGGASLKADVFLQIIKAIG